MKNEILVIKGIRKKKKVLLNRYYLKNLEDEETTKQTQLQQFLPDQELGLETGA